MSRFWSDHVSGLVPYVAGEQPKISNLLKLNTNENPYGPSPKALQAIRDAADDRLKLYPDNESTALRQAVGRLHGIAPNQVFVGNGSDEVLAHLFNALFRHQGKPLWMPDITYSFYRTYCLLFDIPVHLVPLDEHFAISVPNYLNAQAHGAAAIIFANPNAPTGLGMPLHEIARIAAANPQIPVVIDEAYVDFGAESATSLIAQHPNLVTVHTFSKSRSLAGLRVGFAMASADIVDGLNRVKDSFNSYPLDRLAQAAAVAAIDDEAWFRQTRQAVIDARESLTTALQELGFQVLPSLTNFVFVQHPQHDAAGIAAALRQQGVLVRHFDKPRIRQFLRITVGTPDECRRLLDCLGSCLGSVPAPEHRA